MNQISFAYWRYGKEYLDAYSIITTKRTNPMDLMNIKFFLLCRSIEQSLKAYFIDKIGFTEEELKLKFWHSLKKLVKELSLGKQILFSLSAREKKIIKLVSIYYENKEFEYFKKGSRTLPQLLDLYKVAQKISNELPKDLALAKALPSN